MILWCSSAMKLLTAALEDLLESSDGDFWKESLLLSFSKPYCNIPSSSSQPGRGLSFLWRTIFVFYLCMNWLSYIFYSHWPNKIILTPQSLVAACTSSNEGEKFQHLGRWIWEQSDGFEHFWLVSLLKKHVKWRKVSKGRLIKFNFNQFKKFTSNVTPWRREICHQRLGTDLDLHAIFLIQLVGNSVALCTKSLLFIWTQLKRGTNEKCKKYKIKCKPSFYFFLNFALKVVSWSTTAW